jgi:4'-phosphopantetheinyl transferase EntD
MKLTPLCEPSVLTDEPACPENDVAWIEGALQDLLPSSCAGAARLVEDAGERDGTAWSGTTDAQAYRRQELAAGRCAARGALERLASRRVESALRDDGPVWPRGIIGSISHADGYAAAAAGPSAAFASVGIDLERSGALVPDLWQLVLNERELGCVRGQPKSEQARLATVYFCAKEAFYKMQFGQTSAWLDFGDAVIEVDLRAGCLVVRSWVAQMMLRSPTPCFQGKFAIGPRFTLVAMLLPAIGDRP